MRAFNGLLQKLLMVVLTVSLLSACSGKEDRKTKYLEKGKSYLAEKNYDKARIEFKNVLQIDPKDAKGYLLLGQVEEKEMNWIKSFGYYKKASELDPELIAPRISLAKFYLLQASALKARKDETGVANALGLVQEQIKEIRARDPENVELLTLEATLLANDGDIDKAISQLEKVIGRTPELESAAVLLSSLYDKKKRTEEAATVLINAAKMSSEPISLQQRLAVHYVNSKQNDKAEAILRQIVKENPEKLNYLVVLASFFNQSGQTEKAEQVLDDAIVADPEDAQRYLLYAEYLATQSSKEVAIEKLKQFIKQQPDMTDLQMSLIKLYLENEQNDEAQRALQVIIDGQGTKPSGLRARALLAQILAAENIDDERVPALIKEVLDENPRDNGILLLKGKLAASKGDYIEAINSFRSFLKDQPNNSDVLQLLSASHLANKERELALDTLLRGVEHNPGDPELNVALAKLIAQNGDIDDAIERLDGILAVDKYNQPTLLAKFELLASKGDVAGMEEITGLLQEDAPDNEDGYILEARLRFAQKNYPGTIEILDKVLAKNSESVAALIMKADVLAVQKQYEEAMEVVDQLQKARPDLAEDYFRKGQLLIALKDPTAAIAQFEVALKRTPDSAAILAALVNLEMQQGQIDAAEQRLQAILKADPEHTSANVLLGIVYVAKKDFVMAEASFERQLEINPAAAAVYTQLAQARMGNKNIDGAAQAYEDGLNELPNEPRLLIGLAGIREQQQDYEAAISVYEKVLDIQPGNAVGTNNLAALLADHRSDKASLAKAVELSASLEKTSQTAFLDTAGWVYYRNGDYDKAVDILKGVTETAPTIAVFQYHLGMAYFRQGNLDAAREYLGKATAGDYSYQGIEEARATLKSM